VRSFFTSRERRVVLFLSTIFLLGNGIRLYRKTFPAEGGEALRLGSLEPADSIEVARLLEESRAIRDQEEKAKHVELPLDVNKAAVWELTALPGIGPERAEKIIKERERKEGFKALTDLLDVSGIGKKSLAALEDYILPLPSTSMTEGAVTSEVIDINTATVDQLESLPGIGSVIAARIIDEREDGGPYLSVADLQRVKGIGKKRLEDLELFLRIE